MVGRMDGSVLRINIFAVPLQHRERRETVRGNIFWSPCSASEDRQDLNCWVAENRLNFTDPEINTPILTYSVINREKISSSGSSKMVYRIVFDVEEIPSQESMRETAESVWTNGNTKWEEFTVFGYLPGMDVGSAAYAVAKVRQTGMTDFRIQSFALPGATRLDN